jgi:hypothetical protein
MAAGAIPAIIDGRDEGLFMSAEIALPQRGERNAALTGEGGAEPASAPPAVAPASAVAADAPPIDQPNPSDSPALVTNWPLKIMAAIAIVAALYIGQDLFVPLLFAGLISYALDPMHRRLVKWHVPHALAAVVLMIGLLGVMVTGALALQNQAAAFLEKLPTITEKLRESVRDGRGSIGSTVQPVQEAAAELKKVTDGPSSTEKGVTRVQVEQAPMRLSDFLWRGTVSVFGLVAQTTMVLFLVYYMLASGDQFNEAHVRQVADDVEINPRLGIALDGIGHLVSGFHRHGAFVHDDFVTRHRRCNITRDAFDKAEVNRAVGLGGRRDGDEDHVRFRDAVRRARSKAQAICGHVPDDQVLQARLENRDDEGAQGGDLGFIVIHANDSVPGFGEAGSGDEANVTCSNDGEFHAYSSVRFALI